MKTKDLIQHIAASTSMTKTHTEDMLNATVAVLQKELLAGKSVQLHNFGLLEMQRKSARVVVHPKTRERTEIPEKMQLTFKPTQAVKDQFYRNNKED
ncbi:MAG: HU family DNA-binding protein [Paludibacteraceae bacterium]|jgi:DNA-binding protein HU-beta|nr:HU family DNA-binding protein [Paludibacteraceae bacterium]